MLIRPAALHVAQLNMWAATGESEDAQYNSWSGLWTLHVWITRYVMEFNNRRDKREVNWKEWVQSDGGEQLQRCLWWWVNLTFRLQLLVCEPYGCVSVLVWAWRQIDRSKELKNLLFVANVRFMSWLWRSHLSPWEFPDVVTSRQVATLDLERNRVSVCSRSLLSVCLFTNQFICDPASSHVLDKLSSPNIWI